jgi:hypothetical protein
MVGAHAGQRESLGEQQPRDVQILIAQQAVR